MAVIRQISDLGVRAIVLPPGALRLVLALLVFISHTSRYNVGVLGVMLFFLLSGYWVTSILRTKFADHNVGWFYASRYFRIIPIFLLLAIPAAFVFDKPLLQNMLLFGVASNIEEDPLGVSWSLDIELQFYLILPFILWLFSKINLWAIGGSIALAVAGWWAFEHSGIATVFQYLPAFIIGAYIYDNQISGSLRSAILGLIAFAALTIGIWLHPDFSRFLFKWNGTIEGTEIFSMIWMLPLIPYVAYSLTIKSSLMDRHLGNLSYPFYLVHTLVLAGATFWLSGIPRVVGALIVTFAISSIIYVLFDQPMERLRYKYLTPRKPREVEAQPR